MIPVKSLDDLMEAAHGYQRSMALFTALKLGVFSSLAGGSADAAALARRVGADARRLAVLLNALTAMGLLRKTGTTYRNGEVASSFLTDGPRSKTSILLHHLDCWRDWSHLEEKVQAGRKARSRGEDDQENFIRGMEENARERAATLARRIRLRPGERVLDLGGGPGTYAVEWVRRYPEALVTLFDTPVTLRVTRKILREKGVSDLICLLEGDFLKDPIGGPYEFIWISQILHAFSERDCISLLKKARRALVPGGRAAVQEFLLREDKTSPPGPAFFSVHMVAVTEGGRAYSAGEISAMLTRAGFGKVTSERTDPRGVGVLLARA